jgi:uncharacterized protein YndB with AHSA1/START domain
MDTLVVEILVAAPPQRAFAVWTERCSSWWPADHTLSRDPRSITFEPYNGGRIVERGPDGAEYDWGEIIEWQPPTLVRYSWHLFFDRAEATEVAVRFSATPDGTLVRIEQSGWDRLGAVGPPRRERTEGVWRSFAAPYAIAAAATQA